MSPVAKQVLENLFNRSKPNSFVVLLNSQKKKGRKLEEIMKEMKSFQNKIIPTHSASELSAILTTILNSMYLFFEKEKLF